MAELPPQQDAIVNDAWDEPDTGVPPCDFCRREHPCGCNCMVNGDEACMCTCGRCLAEPRPVWRG